MHVQQHQFHCHSWGQEFYFGIEQQYVNRLSNPFRWVRQVLPLNRTLYSNLK